MVKLIRGYQLAISPYLGSNCRYHPTCSAYAIEAVRVHGGLMGGWLALRRLLRCHPLGGHGYDPVPEPKNKVADNTELADRSAVSQGRAREE